VVSIYERRWVSRKGESKTAYRVSYTVDGKQRQKQFRTRRLASIFVSRLEGVINQERAEAAAQQSPTLDQLFRQWIAARKVGADGNPPLEPGSIYQYETEYRTRISPALGPRRIAELTPRDMRQFLNELAHSGLRRSSVKKVFGTLRTILSYGVLVEELGSNPATGIRIKADRRREGLVIAHEKDDMRKIIQVAVDLAVSSNNRKRKEAWVLGAALLHVLVYGGLRIGEARALSREHIEWDKCCIHIKQRADAWGRIGRPKSARSSRKVLVPDVVIEWLKKLRDLHDRPLLFSTRSGRPIDQRNIARAIWHPLQRLAGVPVLRIHSTRHFYASLMIDSGINPKQLSQDMGHHSEAFTMSVYGHLFKDAGADERNRALKNSAVL